MGSYNLRFSRFGVKVRNPFLLHSYLVHRRQHMWIRKLNGGIPRKFLILHNDTTSLIPDNTDGEAKAGIYLSTVHPNFSSTRLVYQIKSTCTFWYRYKEKFHATHAIKIVRGLNQIKKNIFQAPLYHIHTVNWKQMVLCLSKFLKSECI